MVIKDEYITLMQARDRQTDGAAIAGILCACHATSSYTLHLSIQ